MYIAKEIDNVQYELKLIFDRDLNRYEVEVIKTDNNLIINDHPLELHTFLDVSVEKLEFFIDAAQTFLATIKKRPKGD